MSKLRVAIGAIILFVVFAALAAFLLGPSNASYVNQTQFDSEKWKATLETQDPTRQAMISSLLETHSLIGMSAADIDSLLGKPPSTNYFKDYDYVYWLGPESGPFGIDSEWLCIKFADGKVAAADIKTD